MIKNELLHQYFTNDEDWFDEFKKNWKMDPIVSFFPVKNDKFRIAGWGFNTVAPEHIQYCEHRYNITGAKQGFTAYRSLEKDSQKVTEFYAIACTDKNLFSFGKIMDSFFVKQSLRQIIHVFSQSH